MRKVVALLVSWLIVVCATAPSLAGTPPPLSFDPFRPRPEPPGDVGTGSRNGKGSRQLFSAVLRSTVVAGDRSLVNLGGEILSVGEEAFGYRLLEVRPFDATFEKEGQRVRLEVESDKGEKR
jgi:hypothetical protein